MPAPYPGTPADLALAFSRRAPRMTWLLGAGASAMSGMAADAARMVVTTNFDDLVEQAAREVLDSDLVEPRGWLPGDISSTLGQTLITLCLPRPGRASR